MNKYIPTAIILVVLVAGLGILATRDVDAPTNMSAENTQATTTYFNNHNDALHGTTTDYYPEDQAVTGYLSVPEGVSEENPAPGIILIHEWWGLNDDIKQMADDFANEGYVALAVDMYGEEPTASSSVAQQRAQSVRENMEQAMQNLSAAVSYLENRSDVDEGKIATVGWCFGGGWAYQMAVNDIGVDASVMYYGQFDPEDDFEHMRSSILGHFGEEDTVIEVDNAREFKAELENADQSSVVYIYPNVGHSFANYQGGDNLDYSPEAAEQAWNRTLEFLNDHLRRETMGKREYAEKPRITDIAPEAAPVGARVKIEGAGFSEDSHLHFGSIGIVPRLVSVSSETILFDVPAAVGPPCLYGGETVCHVQEQEITSGVYSVHVRNKEEKSNEVRFEVIKKE